MDSEHTKGTNEQAKQPVDADLSNATTQQSTRQIKKAQRTHRIQLPVPVKDKKKVSNDLSPVNTGSDDCSSDDNTSYNQSEPCVPCTKENAVLAPPVQVVQATEELRSRNLKRKVEEQPKEEQDDTRDEDLEGDESDDISINNEIRAEHKCVKGPLGIVKHAVQSVMSMIKCILHLIVSMVRYLLQFTCEVCGLIYKNLCAIAPVVLGVTLFMAGGYALEIYHSPNKDRHFESYSDKMEYIFRLTTVAFVPIILSLLHCERPSIRSKLMQEYIFDLSLQVLSLLALASAVSPKYLYLAEICLQMGTAFRLLYWIFYSLNLKWLQKVAAGPLALLTILLLVYTFLIVTGQEFGFMPRPAVSLMKDASTQTDNGSVLRSLFGWLMFPASQQTQLYEDDYFA